MARHSPAQLFALARTAGLSATEAVLAAAIALGESGGDPDAIGDKSLVSQKWGPSVGLWQIRSLNAELGTGGTRDQSRLRDPDFNARSMVAIYRAAGSKFTPWSVFTSGRYREHLNTVTTASKQPEHPRASDASGHVENAPTKTSGPLGPLVDAFNGWQADLQGVLVKLAVAGAGLALVVAGVKSAAGGDDR